MSTIKALGIPKIKALGLNNTGGIDKSQQKSLSIIYKSCAKDDKFIYLYFEIETKNIKKGNTTIFVQEMNATNEFAVPPYNLNVQSNGKTNVKTSFPINKKFDRYSWQEGFVYQATVTCDGLSEKTEEFKLVFSKQTTKSKTCFCNRGITSEELKNIIIELRKQEVYIENGKLVRDTKGSPILKNGKKQFIDITMYDELHEDLFNLDYPEKLNSSEANFNKFAEALNKVFKDYDINTCIRKIHFLAQCYHETQRFTITYEKSPNSNVSGGAFYRGRGLIQLTHNYNYEKLRKALKINSTLNEFVPRVAKEINFACQASGYFWKNIGAKTGNINQYADKDDVLTVSREINGYVSVPNGFNDRKLFTEILKKVMKYETCKNKK
ncbi:glycoside hydrolase family 19 protein [Chryseobacterium wangxinyae]|uniref:glycoside hydrolase family 19 protein n=1 Tax=Chryseobacterium sp. CY353 TaxID=2997334 RepID=UPI00226D62DE|nr:hypothetical protein [Chryseobacterium sp. CY353]MCY0968971.1 hypothetical protein [Chryseobacterium sp. CY353]